jgi:phosphate transport system substrate-binding protein
MRSAFALLALLIAAPAAALDVVPPPHQARKEISGVVRVWGNAAMRPMLERWQQGFRRAHPEVRFENRLTGSDVGMAGLYTGQADIALAGRDAGASEVKAFEWIYRYRPERVEIMTGFDSPGRSPALVAYVHRDNPLAHLTLAQLDAIFSHERLRGAPAALRTWGELGIAGEWAGQPINLYTFDTETGTGRYFRDAALKDSRKLHWERMTEFKDADGSSDHDAGRRILEALAADRFGLAVASGPARGPVKALALSTAESAGGVAPTRDNIASRRYPFARGAFAYYNRKPGTPLDAPVAEFLRYVLGRDEQRDVGADGFLPLDDALARAQSQRLQ